jgi:hypothetical protein
MKRLLLTSLALLQLSFTGNAEASANTVPVKAVPTDVVEAVSVVGVRDPEWHPYRHMIAGLEMFESKRHLAPKAPSLRFLIIPSHATESMDGLSLRISSDTSSIKVPIAPDGSFILPFDQAAIDSEAELVLNRTKGRFTAIPLVKSENVPANMRRLGDIRLECKVSIAIAKKSLNFAVRAAGNVAMLGSDWCQSSRINYKVTAPILSDSITLISGDRRAVMAMGRLQKYFDLPLRDNSWPDDTLIEFKPAAPASLADFAAVPIYLRGSMNKWDQSVQFKQIDANTYSVETMLPKGISKFQIASVDNRMVNLGISDSKANEIKDNFTVNAGKKLAWAGKDVWFEPPQAGKYTFTLSVVDPLAPVLTITPFE